jgi:predicted DNA binding CopG/RHH family protein
MKYIELDNYEKKILEDYEKGKLKPLSGLKQAKKRYHQYTRSVLDKTKNVNIRISEGDLLKIKSLAVKKGIPYQTMLTSVIHQYSSGQIQETR